MDVSDIADWAREHGAEIPDMFSRRSFRGAARLTDGTYLPCVQFCEAQSYIQLALDRFEESRTSGVTDPNNLKPGFYPSVVRSFVASGNRINHYDIAELEASPFAIPLERVREIEGETSMSWTAFAAIMDDAREFSFGTTWNVEFFNMPPGYTASQIRKILPHKNEAKPVYRERPHFICYLEDVEFGAA